MLLIAFYYQLEKDDIIEDLEVVEQALPSLTSLTNWGEIPSKQQLQRRRGSKSIIERKISVSSIVSDDSFTIGKNYCNLLPGTPFAFKYWWGSVYQLGKGEKKK